MGHSFGLVGLFWMDEEAETAYTKTQCWVKMKAHINAGAVMMCGVGSCALSLCTCVSTF